MRELLAVIFGFLVLLAVIFAGAYPVKSFSCGQRWGDYEYRYSFFGGCQVKEDGKWTPEDRVRVVQ